LSKFFVRWENISWKKLSVPLAVKAAIQLLGFQQHLLVEEIIKSLNVNAGKLFVFSL
jgi:hypothetical protein